MESVSNIAHSFASPSELSGHRSKHDFADAIAKTADRDKAALHRRSAGGEKPTESRSQSSEKVGDSLVEDRAKSPDVNGSDRAMQSATVRPVGQIENVDEARIYGVHLLAGRYLSELGRGTAQELPCGELVQGVFEPANGRASMAAAAAPSAPFLSAGDQAPLSDPRPLVGLTTMGERAMESPVHEIGSGEVMAAMPSAHEWLERSLRFARDRQGDMVAWVRDFRIDDQQAGALVGDLLDQAKANGIALARIMLNGHAIWNSTKEV